MMKMKKYSILVAAFAVLAFVGCKKENNGSLVADQNGMITLEMSGETHQDNGKQSFYGTANRIFFNDGDQMIVNGSVCNVTPQAVAGDELATEYLSYKAKVAILAEYAYTPLYAMYPAEAFTLGTAADYSDMTVTMYDTIDMFTVADEAVLLTGGLYQPWPMTAYLENLNTPRIQLKNNIALVSPSVKFGYPFVNQFVQDNNLNVIVDPNNLPTLNVEKVVISSSDQNLYGSNGYIDGLATQEPKLVFPGIPSTPSALVCNVPVDRGYGIIATGTSEWLLGNVAVPPMAAGKHVKMDVYFSLQFGDATPIDCLYEGDEIVLPNDRAIGRSRRATFVCNLFDADIDHKVSLQ